MLHCRPMRSRAESATFRPGAYADLSVFTTRQDDGIVVGERSQEMIDRLKQTLGTRTTLTDAAREGK